METFDAISKRASVRKYQSRGIEKPLLEKLVDAARKAPTARAVEPWEFVVITEKEMLEKLGQIADHGPFIKDAGACIAVYCEDTKYYLEDGCAATENILLASADQGLGACWVAGDKKTYAEEVTSVLGVPSGKKLISLISIGWPESEANQSKQRSLGDVIHWERY